MGATHSGLFYEDDRQFAAEAGGFLREGLAQGHRGLVIASPRRSEVLREELAERAEEVTFVDDATAYAPQWNVYRLLLEFASAVPGTRSRVVAERALAGGTPAEVVDFRRIEAAAAIVFAGHDIDLLCPYDVGSLPPSLADIGRHTHETVRADGLQRDNPDHADPRWLMAALATVVPPPGSAEQLSCAGGADLARARRLVRQRGAEAGLAEEVVADLALAVTEVLTNALLHGAPPVVLHVYAEGASWVCHVRDGGSGELDPLLGVVPPPRVSESGYGLWLARQLCAAVDVGRDTTGTHVRLHARLR
jgi:anti-sigma regulatory factor (Ser/Thr protein kinase)